MKSIYYVSILLMFVLSVPCRAAGDAPSGNFKEVARKEIYSLKDTSIENLRLLGFDSRPDLDKVEVGEGFEIFTIDPGKLMDETSPQDLQSLVTSTNGWDFPLIVDGKAKTLLKLRFTEGKWFPSGMGSAKFLKEMSAFRAAWPASSGYQFRLIRSWETSSHIIELSRNGKFVGIVPLSTFYRVDSKSNAKAVADSGTGHPFDPHDLRSDPQEVLSDLRASVRRRLRKEQ